MKIVSDFRIAHEILQFSCELILHAFCMVHIIQIVIADSESNTTGSMTSANSRSQLL